MPSTIRSGLLAVASLRKSVLNPLVYFLPTTSATSGQVCQLLTVPDKNDWLVYKHNHPTAVVKASDVSIPEPETSILESQKHNLLMESNQRTPVLATRTGEIDWIVAGLGVRLWLCAQDRVGRGCGDTALLRSMHIDALRYMCLALPADVANTEVETIRASLPPAVLSTDSKACKVVAARPNLLRESIAYVICWIMALIVIVVPITITLLNKAIEYEHKYRPVRRLLENGTALVTEIGTHGLEFRDTFVQYGESPLGKACLEAVSWLVEGVASGLNDGLIMSTRGRSISPR